MDKPLIGILASYEKDGQHMFAGYPRLVVNQDYTRSVEEAGGLPLVIAPTTDRDNLDHLLGLVQGLVFVGGADIDPSLYGQAPKQKTCDPEPVRDQFESLAFDLARQRGLPIFGVCRGLQLINALAGGSLHQDLAYVPTELKHQFARNPEHPVHCVKLEGESFLTRATGRQELKVNSYHHQAVADLAPGFKACALAPDGVIEAIEAESDQFIAAVQWHPEMMSKSCPEAKKIFAYFVQVCRQNPAETAR